MRKLYRTLDAHIRVCYIQRMTGLTLLKLGGSLITDKDKPFTPRLDKLNALADDRSVTPRRSATARAMG
ncbi:hypothetical protein FBQ79_11600 [Anaerolineae bacterium AMX1]|nr:hypothetical protein [Anaerolineae bacterium AMX1]